MERRKFIKKSGQILLAASTLSVTASFLTSCIQMTMDFLVMVTMMTGIMAMVTMMMDIMTTVIMMMDITMTATMTNKV